MQVESHLQAYERSRWNSKNSSYELFLSFHVFHVLLNGKQLWSPHGNQCFIGHCILSV